jgi:DNA-binding transcriptional MocR family regulator
VFTEKPTYYGALGAIFSRGAQAVEIPLDDEGIDVEALKKLLKLYAPKFIYVMPCYQTPTGLCYSLKRKRELLELAYKHNFYIVEEDNMGDFCYTEDKPVPLKALDYRNRVIYVKSFSKILMPGLRIGYMILPKPISQAVTSAKYSTDISTSGFIQRAFELYLKSGEHYTHIDRMCQIFKEKYLLITKLIDEKLLKYFEYNKSGGGLTLWLKMRNNKISADDLHTELAKIGVLVMPGSLFANDDELTNGYIRLSFANVTNEEIINGIEALYQACKNIFD